MPSQTEENYLKAIFKIQERNRRVTTTAIAGELNTSAASVTDMLKRLADKKLITYKKYKGVALTRKGATLAKNLIRKHRLWEVFLVEKLGFAWDEVHDIAEQLEHIQSPELTERLDAFLNFPTHDPHGDPIPDKNGNIPYVDAQPLSSLHVNEKGIIAGMDDTSDVFLRYLDEIGIGINTRVELLDIRPFDASVLIKTDSGKLISLSARASKNLLVKKLN